jgi:hypothetical protein
MLGFFFLITFCNQTYIYIYIYFGIIELRSNLRIEIITNFVTRIATNSGNKYVRTLIRLIYPNKSLAAHFLFGQISHIRLSG